VKRITLSPELTDQIIFAMENQVEEFFFDLQNLEVLTEEELAEAGAFEDSDVPGTPEAGEPDADRFPSIPRWSSAQGFQLMERFTASLNNPLYRQELSKALSSGRGVFRKFKDVLHQHAPLEKLWYNYKEKEMRREVREWFSRNLDALELASLGPEPEETEDLLLTDFPIGFQECTGYLEADEVIEAVVDEICQDEEGFVKYSLGFREYLFEHIHEMMDSSDQSGRIGAVSPDGTLAGALYITAFQGSDDSLSAFIPFLFVVPEFRGLGLAKTLIERGLKEAEHWGASECTLDLPGTASLLASAVEEMGLSRWSGSYIFRRDF
jgi:GNAT superfamily N-acetyltransferase